MVTVVAVQQFINSYVNSDVARPYLLLLSGTGTQLQTTTCTAAAAAAAAATMVVLSDDVVHCEIHKSAGVPAVTGDQQAGEEGAEEEEEAEAE